MMKGHVAGKKRQPSDALRHRRFTATPNRRPCLQLNAGRMAVHGLLSYLPIAVDKPLVCGYLL